MGKNKRYKVLIRLFFDHYPEGSARQIKHFILSLPKIDKRKGPRRALAPSNSAIGQLLICVGARKLYFNKKEDAWIWGMDVV